MATARENENGKIKFIFEVASVKHSSFHLISPQKNHPDPETTKLKHYSTTLLKNCWLSTSKISIELLRVFEL